MARRGNIFEKIGTVDRGAYDTGAAYGSIPLSSAANMASSNVSNRLAQNKQDSAQTSAKIGNLGMSLVKDKGVQGMVNKGVANIFSNPGGGAGAVASVGGHEVAASKMGEVAALKAGESAVKSGASAGGMGAGLAGTAADIGVSTGLEALGVDGKTAEVGGVAAGLGAAAMMGGPWGMAAFGAGKLLGGIGK